MQALTFPFRFVGGKVTLARSYDQIVRDQLVDSIMTNYRERVMRPEYGADVQALLFDPTDELRKNDSMQVLKQRLTYMVPRATILSVEILDNPVGDSSTVYILVRYQVNSYDDPVDLTIPVPLDT